MQKRTGPSIASSSSSKKVRFDPSHPSLLASGSTAAGSSSDTTNNDNGAVPDALFETDIAAPHASASRRHAVKVDGYESDSSEDDQHSRLRARRTMDGQGGPVDAAAARMTPGQAGAGDDDEDDDMFAETPVATDMQGKARAEPDQEATRFLSLEEIPGQELDGRRERQALHDDGFPAHAPRYNPDEEELGDAEELGSDNASMDDEMPDEEVGALGRKRNAPKMDAFNMKAELEQGQFDTDGNYIRQAKDVKDTQDVWLKDVSKKDIAAAREAVAKRQEEERRRAQAEETTATVGELLSELVSFLEKGETLLEALQRFGVLAGSSRKVSKRASRKQHGPRGDKPEAATGLQRQAAAAIERLTQLANQLMARLPLDLYELEREGLTRAYQRETGEVLEEGPSRTLSADESTGTDQWEFRYVGAEEVHGPYTKEDLLDWLAEGRFSEHAAEARRLGEEDFLTLNPELLR